MIHLAGVDYRVERQLLAEGEECYLLRVVGEKRVGGNGRDRTQPPPPVRLISCREAHEILEAQRMADERRVEKEAKRKARAAGERAERDEQERIARLVRNARAVRAAATGREDGPNVVQSVSVATPSHGLGCGAYVGAVLAVIASWVIWAIVEAIVTSAGY